MKESLSKWLAIFSIVLIFAAGFVIGYKVREPEKVVVEKLRYVSLFNAPSKSTTIDVKPIKLPLSRIIFVDSTKSNVGSKDIPGVVESPTLSTEIKDTPGGVIEEDSIVLKWETKHYSDSTYDAWISGVYAQLDSIKTYSSDRIITRTEYKDAWYLGPMLSVDASSKFVRSTVGVELSIPYNKWRFNIYGGYNVMGIDKLNHGWTGGVKVSYNILNR